MNNLVMDIWKEDRNARLAQVMVNIRDVRTMQSFLRDVMTEKEITEIAARLQAARMLTSGKTYVEITQETKLSSRTVARISEWLKGDTNGYAAALELVESHHAHLSPARD